MEQGFLAGVSQGWDAQVGMEKTAAEQPYAKQAAADQASLLSTKAQEQKLQAQEHQQAYAQQMATRVAMEKAGSETDLKSSQDTLNFWQRASDAAQDPAIKMQMMANKEAEQNKINENTIKAGKAKEANQLIDVATIKEAFTDPTASVSKLRLVGLQTGNQALGRLADQIENNAPIQAPGLQGRTFGSLSGMERSMYLDYLDKQLGPKTEQSAIAKTLQIGQQAQNERDKVDIEAQKSRDRQTDIAAKREGMQDRREKARDKSTAMDASEARYQRQKAKLEDDLYGRGNIPGIEEEIKNPKSHMYNTASSKIPNPAYEAKLKQIKDLETSHEESMAKFEAADQTPKAKLTADDNQAISWAKANPKDPRAVKILKQHGL